METEQRIRPEWERCQHPTVSKQQRKPDPWLYELQSSPLPDMMGVALLLYLCVRWVHVCMCAMARVWKSQGATFVSPFSLPSM